MGWKSYEDLDVYQKSYKLALDIHKASADFPKEEQYSLTSQLRRSSKSICANIVEGQAKSAKSVPEFCRFLNIAVGSAEETRLWIRFCKDLEFLDGAESKKYDDNYLEIVKMLRGLMKSLRS
ncbi:MAG: four helix bundle protein [Micavibrio sp.]|nr:MAG: four helix bundle protein [Micavibrio sp.]